MRSPELLESEMRRESSTNFTEIKMIIKESCELSYGNKLADLDKADKSLDSSTT
jgi:hypothetical protein